MEELVEGLILTYAMSTPTLPLSPSLSLRRDLSIDSLSLVSLTLRLGDELHVDLVALGLDLGRLDTVGDLVELARTLQPHAASGGQEHGIKTTARS